MNIIRKNAIAMGLCVFILITAQTASAALVSYVSTENGALISANRWAPSPDGSGYRIDWLITPNSDSIHSWHYVYEFGAGDGSPLNGLTSHIILQLSDTATPDDVFNVDGDVQEATFGTFGLAPGNPGFPEDESIFGVKFDLTGNQTIVEFDSTRQPMWGDFYAKDGGHPIPYVYNADLGVHVANPNDYNAIPVDAAGNPLHKILVPDTIVTPEPATTLLLLIGFLPILRPSRRR